jgi:hypothetical protein
VPETSGWEVRATVKSDGTPPLGCVHKGQENTKGNTVAAKDVRGIQNVLFYLIHAPIHDDVQGRPTAIPSHIMLWSWCLAGYVAGDHCIKPGWAVGLLAGR